MCEEGEMLTWTTARTTGEDVVGIWIFEPSQRDSVGQQMLK